jgi:hypothetical protein
MLFGKRLFAVVLVAVLIFVGIPASGTPAGDAETAVPAHSRATGVIVPLVSGINDTIQAIDWNPSDGTALLVGDNGTVLKYNSTSGFTNLQQDNNFTFHSVAFRPLNTSTLAILVGEELKPIPPNPSVVMLYDGATFTRVSSTSYRETKSVTWATDASVAYLTAQKGIDGALVKYQAGALTEVLVDTVNSLNGICTGDGGYYVYGFDFDNQATSLRFFDGTAIVRNVTLPAMNDYSPQDLAWSGGKSMGLMTGFATELLRFNSTLATKVTDAALKGDLSGVCWNPAGSLSLITGWESTGKGLLYTYDGSVLSTETSAVYDGLTDAAWNTAGKFALVTGENGTVLRYSAANTRPTCAITSPPLGSVLNGTVKVSGTAFDPDGDPITEVSFKVDSGSWEIADGGENWSIDWDTTSYTNDKHYLYAKSSDGMDESVSDTRMVFVANPNHPPDIYINTPADGSIVVGTVSVTGNASDPDAGDAVTTVWVKIDDGSWTSASGTAGWSYSWQTSQVQDGIHSIKARSTDGEANSSDASVTVTVQNHGPNFPPSCSITSPAAGTTVMGQVQIQGTASDPDNGVQAVYVKIDGGSWLPATGNGSWTYIWDTVPVSGGSHTILARAYDGIVNSSDSRLTLTVNHPPACTITNPASGSTLTGETTITGTASDPDSSDSIAAVYVKIDSGDWVKVSGTLSWNHKWNTSTASSGQHTIYAKSADGKVDSAETSRSVTVEKPPVPVTVSNPDEYGEDFVVLLWSRNIDTDFARYEVYRSESENTPVAGLVPNIIGSQSVTTYNATGLKSRTTYWFRVRVVDTTGLTSMSNEVYATTLQKNNAPIPVVTASRKTAHVGETITFNAEGSYDPDRGGRIAKYEWDLEGRSRFPLTTGTIGSTRHEFSKAGPYMVQVRITDDRGAVAVGSVNITIIEPEKAGTDPMVFAVIGIIIAVGVIGGILYLRSRAPPPMPQDEEGYVDEVVREPARRRRRDVWDGEQEAPKRRPVRKMARNPRH